MSLLKCHDRGSRVRQLQLMLNTALRGRGCIIVDGSFGPQTERAVQAFQRARGLDATGVVDDGTWRALGQRDPTVPSRLVLETAKDPEWLRVAFAELGVKEMQGATLNHERIREYHSHTTLGTKSASLDETPWCSSFVNWAVWQAGYVGTRNAMAKSWLTWGDTEATASPRRGAIVVILNKLKSRGADHSTGSSSGYHVAFLLERSASALRMLGGNQQNAVSEAWFSLSKYEVQGYRWPPPTAAFSRRSFLAC